MRLFSAFEGFASESNAMSIRTRHPQRQNMRNPRNHDSWGPSSVKPIVKASSCPGFETESGAVSCSLQNDPRAYDRHRRTNHGGLSA